VTCDEARLLIGADPGAATTALEEHLATCAACARFRDEMRSLDADIRRALERPPDIARPRSGRQPLPWRQWALAASVVLATFAVLGVWIAGRYQEWLPGTHAIVLGIGVALVAPVGDLFESFVKREAHTKDSGGLFGAHGGALDRLDAVLFAVVVGYYIWAAYSH